MRPVFWESGTIA